MHYQLDFSTSHHQIFICDKVSTQDTGSESFWTEDAATARLAIGSGMLGVGLESYNHFKGYIFLLDTKNQDLDFQQFDHVVEGGLTIHSGVLQVMDCFNSGIQLEVELSPGHYRVRIYSVNLDSVKDDDSGDDFYRIEIWPDVGTERVVVKQYQYHTE